MNVKIQNRNVELTEALKATVERRSRKARKMLPTFRAHDLDLHVSLEKLSTGKSYQVSLVLAFPQTAIRVEDIQDSALTAVTGAFDDLMRKIKRFKSQLSRERFWQRQPAKVPGGAAAPSGLVKVEEAINANLDKVENYIRRELFHQALIERFPPGLLQPQALVDEVFLDVSSRINAKPANLSLEQWMFQIAREKVSQKIRNLDGERDQPHIEELRFEQDQWDDEVLNFYQPDEALRLEDLLTDTHSDNPEQILASEEMEEQVQKIIAGLPRSVRESFVLYALEGFNSDEVAMITGKQPKQVKTEVEQARTQLRQQLIP